LVTIVEAGILLPGVLHSPGDANAIKLRRSLYADVRSAELRINVVVCSLMVLEFYYDASYANFTPVSSKMRCLFPKNC
jgi:hypothetical protein